MASRLTLVDSAGRVFPAAPGSGSGPGPAAPDPATAGRSSAVAGDVVAQITSRYAFQSYFHSTLLHNAIKAQPPSNPIVPSTADERSVRGRILGLHPSSQTPIAVSFRSTKAGASGVFILTPGQTIRPFGGTAFESIRWGLPFGWLGGGIATLVVLSDADADLGAHGNPELIFHRARFAIKQPADLTAAGSFNNAPKNWPLRFPWPNAAIGASALPQGGEAQIAIAEPTKLLLVLQGVTALAAAAAMRIFIQASQEVGLDSTDAAVLTLPIWDEFTWPSFASLGTTGNMATQRAALLYTGIAARVAADAGGVLFVDASGSAALNGLFVDVVRYGKL